MRRKHSIYLLLLLLLIPSAGCPKGRKEDPFRTAVRAVDAIAASIGQAIIVKRELVEAGKLSPREDYEISSALLRVNIATSAVQRGLAEAYGKQDQPDWEQLLAALYTATDRFDHETVFNIVDPKSQGRFQVIVSSIRESLEILRSALAAGKEGT